MSQAPQRALFKRSNHEPSRTTLAPVFCYVSAKYQLMVIQINTNYIFHLSEESEETIVLANVRPESNAKLRMRQIKMIELL